jgi:hypothetical protein
MVGAAKITHQGCAAAASIVSSVAVPSQGNWNSPIKVRKMMAAIATRTPTISASNQTTCRRLDRYWRTLGVIQLIRMSGRWLAASSILRILSVRWRNGTLLFTSISVARVVRKIQVKLTDKRPKSLQFVLKFKV